ncbi:MAG: ankyrin repeat domain-containing protein [Planctomycetota bacterium]
MHESSDLLPQLQRAVRMGDAARCVEILRDEASLATAPSSRGGSLLLEAFEREEDAVAEAFLAVRNDRGITELDIHEASAMGRPAIVQKRLTDDPLVYEEVGPAGFLPLHRAAYRAHGDAVSLLLQMGAEPDARSSNGAALTALHSAVAGAARFGDPEGAYRRVVERLLAAGATPALEMEGGWSALRAAERDGLDGIVEVLTRSAGAHETRED